MPSSLRNMSTAMGLSSEPPLPRALQLFALAISACPSRVDTRTSLPALGRWKLGHQPQRHRQALQLIVRPEIELGGVVPRIAFHLFDGDFGRGQWKLSLGLLAGRR